MNLVGCVGSDGDWLVRILERGGVGTDNIDSSPAEASVLLATENWVEFELTCSPLDGPLFR